MLWVGTVNGGLPVAWQVRRARQVRRVGRPTYSEEVVKPQPVTTAIEQTGVYRRPRAKAPTDLPDPPDLRRVFIQRAA